MRLNRWVEIQEKILKILLEKRQLTTSEVGKKTKIHYETAKKHLEVLEYHKRVEHFSNGRITLWNLIREVRGEE